MATPDKFVALERQLTGLGTLLQLQKKARQIQEAAQFGFFAVNETRTLLRYRQAVFWHGQGRSLKVAAVSGVDLPNRNAPYVLWLQRLFRHLPAGNGLKPVSAPDLPPPLAADWQEWSAAHGLWCPFPGAEKTESAGLWLVRDEPWHPAEQGLAEQLMESYGHAWQALRCRSHSRRRPHSGSGYLKRLLLLLLLVTILIGLTLPVRLSVLAPAQVVPGEPLVVSAPIRGVIKTFQVVPNQRVEAGQPLFRLDDTEARNRLEIARKALAVARAEYRRATQQSLSSRDSAIDGDILRARMEARQTEVDYAAEELARVEVAAGQDGVVIFAEVNDWLGKPVVTGEKVLLLADPACRELEIRVPLDNGLNLEPGARVRLFLNIDPAREILARISRTSYEPREGLAGGLAYVVRASFEQNYPELRMGLTGTAKIFGQEKPLYYYLGRRPWAVLRETLGI